MGIPSLWPAVTGEWARTYNPGIRQMTLNLVRVWLPRQIPSSGFVNALEMGISASIAAYQWLPIRNV